MSNIVCICWTNKLERELGVAGRTLGVDSLVVGEHKGIQDCLLIWPLY